LVCFVRSYGFSESAVPPWPGQAIVIYRNGKKEKIKRGDLLIFAAEKDDWIVMVKDGTNPTLFNAKKWPTE
jgi:hypothetical protein